MVRALLFDLGNVLVYFSHERMCRQIGQLVGQSAPQVREYLFDGGLLARYERGQISTDEMHGELQRFLGQSVNRDALVQAASDIFWENDSIDPVIEGLHRAGFPLVMVSNTCEAHIEWLEPRFDVVKRFDKRVLSYQIGATKPDRAVFERAAELAGAPPHECLFIDDTPGNIAAARQLGFHVERYSDTDALLRALAKRGIRLDG